MEVRPREPSAQTPLLFTSRQVVQSLQRPTRLCMFCILSSSLKSLSVTPCWSHRPPCPPYMYPNSRPLQCLCRYSYALKCTWLIPSHTWGLDATVTWSVTPFLGTLCKMFFLSPPHHWYPSPLHYLFPWHLLHSVRIILYNLLLLFIGCLHPRERNLQEVRMLVYSVHCHIQSIQNCMPGTL